jgi:hypothetical protein
LIIAPQAPKKLGKLLFQYKMNVFKQTPMKGRAIQLTPPTQNVFYISAILLILALLGTFVSIPFVSDNAFWVAVIGYVLLFFGNTVKGM